MALNTRYTSRNSPSTRVVAMSPIVTVTSSAPSLARLVGHAGTEFDPGHRDTSGGQRQCNPAGSDGELERRALTGELGEQLHRRAKHIGTEHRG